MARNKDYCTVTLNSEPVKNGPVKQRPLLHVLMSDGRVTEFKGMSIAIPEAPADEAESQVLWLAVNGKGEPFKDENGDYVIRESPALGLGRLAPAPTDLISIKEISRLSGLSASTIEREVEREKLATPIRLSPRRNVYRYSDVEQWLERRKQGRR